MNEAPQARVLPPVYLLLAGGIMAALHVLAPGPRWVAAPWRLVGWLPIAGGVAVAFTAWIAFARAGTPVRPFEESTALVTHGPFAATRNPMYLGMVSVLLGTAILLGTVSPFLVPPAFVAFIEHRFVRREERMLEARFGDAYRSYWTRVRRWL